MNFSSKHTRLAGFSLAEVSLALGLFAFVIVVLVGLLGTGITANRGALSDTEAALVLSAVYSDLKFSQGSASEVFGINPTPAEATSTGTQTKYLDRNQKVVTAASPDGYRITVDYTLVPNPAATSTQQGAVEARITVTTPATLDPAVAKDLQSITGQAEVYAAFLRPGNHLSPTWQ